MTDPGTQSKVFGVQVSPHALQEVHSCTAQRLRCFPKGTQAGTGSLLGASNLLPQSISSVKDVLPVENAKRSKAGSLPFPPVLAFPPKHPHVAHLTLLPGSSPSLSSVHTSQKDHPLQGPQGFRAFLALNKMISVFIYLLNLAAPLSLRDLCS